MRNILLGLRWVALPTVVFFLYALWTGNAFDVAVVVLVVVAVVVIAVGAVDLLVRRR